MEKEFEILESVVSFREQIENLQQDLKDSPNNVEKVTIFENMLDRMFTALVTNIDEMTKDLENEITKL